MKDVERAIRESAGKLLGEKKVDLVIGYEKGSLPLRTTPCFIRRAEDVERLVWNESCENNLAKYLLDRKERVALIGKSCDVRSILETIKERQVMRDMVIIVGILCEGVLDRKKIEARVEGKEILEAIKGDGEITLKGRDFGGTFKREELLSDSCLSCRHRNPPLFDLGVGEKVPEGIILDEFAKVIALEAKSVDERWAYFSGEASRCIRCYACRNACPLCYCKECFVDQTQPQWFGKTREISDTLIFHIVRAFHVAGRCVDCGACVRACPMHLDLRALTKKVEKDVRELYHYEAGLSLEEKSPLVTYRLDDPQDFIR